MTEEQIKQLFSNKFDTEHLKIDRDDSEPDLYLVSVIDDDAHPLVGGLAYVVNSNGRIFETSGSLPPSSRIQEAKEWFRSN